MDCSLPGSFVHGIYPARILEWVAISFSRQSSRSRNQTCVSCLAGRLYHWALIIFFTNSYFNSNFFNQFYFHEYFRVNILMQSLCMPIEYWFLEAKWLSLRAEIPTDGPNCSPKRSYEQCMNKFDFLYSWYQLVLSNVFANWQWKQWMPGSSPSRIQGYPQDDGLGERIAKREQGLIFLD